MKKLLTGAFIILCLYISLCTYVGIKEVQAEMAAQQAASTFNPIADRNYPTSKGTPFTLGE